MADMKKVYDNLIIINLCVSMRVGNLKPNMEHIYVCLSLRDCSHKIYRFDAKREVSLLYY